MYVFIFIPILYLFYIHLYLHTIISLYSHPARTSYFYFISLSVLTTGSKVK